ncbi:MAG: NAD(P)-dependent oxidoreductase [Spirochaetales bacterium]|nr:NAD(P)-dependent oxidoreductase [Spirochaetales bacterium]
MNVFVTGGTGFIGSHVVAELLRQGHEVTCYARNPHKIIGFSGLAKLHWIEGTLDDLETMCMGLKNQDVCIHLALGWDSTAQGMLQRDTKPAVALAETAARIGLKRFIYVSSTAAIGEYRASMDEDSVCRPLDNYGATKAATEAFVCAISKTYSLPCTIIRPGYVFGEPAVEGAPMEPDDRFRAMVKALKTGEDLEYIRNDGTQFIWVGDLIKVFLASLRDYALTNVYLAVGSEYITWEEICLKARELLGSRSVVRTRDLGWSEAACTYDYSRIAGELGLVFWSRKRICDHIMYISNELEINMNKRIEVYGSSKR